MTKAANQTSFEAQFLSLFEPGECEMHYKHFRKLFRLCMTNPRKDVLEQLEREHLTCLSTFGDKLNVVYNFHKYEKMDHSAILLDFVHLVTPQKMHDAIQYALSLLMYGSKAELTPDERSDFWWIEQFRILLSEEVNR